MSGPESPKMPPIEYEHYDDVLLAKKVMWPLVNHYFHGDWQEQSEPGHSLHITKSGAYGGEDYDVILSAETGLCESDEDPKDGIPMLYIARMEVETIVTDERRDYMVALADKDAVEIADEDIDDLICKVSNCYTFDSDGDIDIDNGHRIEDMEGDYIWSSGKDESEDDDDEPLPEGSLTDEEAGKIIIGAWPKTKLFKHDMELLESGLYVLQAPQTIQQAFDSLLAKPILPRTGRRRNRK